MSSHVLTLVIYAYSSFVAPWGPGPTIVNEFKKTCACEVRLVDAGDGGSLISRVKLEGKNSPADILLGLDQGATDKITRDLKWSSKPIEFDYGPLAFVYNSNVLKNPPHSLNDLLKPQLKGQILLEDPRLSTTGLGFLLWIIKEKGTDGAWDYLKRIKSQVKMITPSWDLAYGLFKKNQGQLVLSFWTSPAYHIQEEKRRDIKAIAFEKGNYLQKEYMLATPNKTNLALQTQFLNFMLGDFAQETLPLRNFMYPVRKVKLPPAFEEIGPVKELEPLDPTTDQLNEWLKKWREIFS